MASRPAFQGRCVLYKLAGNPACALDTPPLAASKKQQRCLSLGTAVTWVREHQQKKMQLTNIISSNTCRHVSSPSVSTVIQNSCLSSSAYILQLSPPSSFLRHCFHASSGRWHSQIWKVAGRRLLLVLILPTPLSTNDLSQCFTSLEIALFLFKFSLKSFQNSLSYHLVLALLFNADSHHLYLLLKFYSIRLTTNSQEYASLNQRTDLKFIFCHNKWDRCANSILLSSLTGNKVHKK